VNILSAFKLACTALFQFFFFIFFGCQEFMKQKLSSRATNFEITCGSKEGEHLRAEMLPDTTFLEKTL